MKPFRSSILLSSAILLLLAQTVHGQDVTIVPDAWIGLPGWVTTNGNVYSTTEFGFGLVIAGDFSVAGGVAANNIAFFDGSQWAAFGDGTSGPVFSVHVYGGLLFAGGDFDEADGASIGNLAVWDGFSWERPFGASAGVDFGGSGPVVRSMSDYKGDLCIGGSFFQVNNVAASNIACNSNGVWHGLGSGTDATVWAIEADEDSLFVGGSFLSAGGSGVSYFAKWDSTNWTSVGPSGTGPNGLTTSIGFMNADIVVGGSFTAVSGLEAHGIARLSNNTWEPFDTSFGEDAVRGSVQDLGNIGGNLIVVGSTTPDFGNTNNDTIALYDSLNAEWITIGTPSGLPRHVGSYEGEVLIAGEFNLIDETSAYGIVAWDAENWHAVGTETTYTVDGPVHAFLPLDDLLWVGGDFKNAGGQSAPHLASWDGISWDVLATGPNGPVYSIVEYQDQICVGGNFSKIGDLDANNIACIAGAIWNVPGGGVTSIEESKTSQVNAMIVDGDMLIVGGEFEIVDNAVIDPIDRKGNIGAYDGTSWHFVEQGLSGPVNALAKSGGDIIVGGSFFTPTGIGVDPFRGAIKWNLTVGWSAFESNIPFAQMDVQDIAVSETNIYFGGDGAFTGEDGNLICGVVKFNTEIGKFLDAIGCIDGYLESVAAVDVQPIDVIRPGETGDYLAVGGPMYGTRLNLPSNPIDVPSNRIIFAWNRGDEVVELIGVESGIDAHDSDPLNPGVLRHQSQVNVITHGNDAFGSTSDWIVGGDFHIVGEDDKSAHLSPFARIDNDASADFEVTLRTDVVTIPLEAEPAAVATLFVNIVNNGPGTGLVVFEGSQFVSIEDSTKRLEYGSSTWPCYLSLRSGPADPICRITLDPGDSLSAQYLLYNRESTLDEGTSYTLSGQIKSLPNDPNPNNDVDFVTIVAAGPTAVEDELEEHRFELQPLYPNPFSGSTSVLFSLQEPGVATLDIYDMLGRRVRSLVDGYRSAGLYRIRWETSDNTKTPLGSGIYMIVLRADDKQAVQTAVVVR